MKSLFLLALALHFCAITLLAQPTPEAAPRASFTQLAETIQAELESHGERAIGHDAYRWSTRLQKVNGCRAEFSVQVTSNYKEAIVQTESISFSLGALQSHSIVLRKNWIELICAGGSKCVYSTSTCFSKSKDGILTDCTSTAQKHAESFFVHYDGDAAAASRMETAFRQYIDLCREAQAVIF